MTSPPRPASCRQSADPTTSDHAESGELSPDARRSLITFDNAGRLRGYCSSVLKNLRVGRRVVRGLALLLIVAAGAAAFPTVFGLRENTNSLSQVLGEEWKIYNRMNSPAPQIEILTVFDE